MKRESVFRRGDCGGGNLNRKREIGANRNDFSRGGGGGGGGGGVVVSGGVKDELMVGNPEKGDMHKGVLLSIDAFEPRRWTAVTAVDVKKPEKNETSEGELTVSS